MQMVQGLSGRSSSAAASSGGASGASSAGSAGTSSSGGGSKTMSMLSTGSSAVAALSDFAMSLQKSASLRGEARAEEMSSDQEYIQAQEKANAINAQYGTIAGQQLAVASASGVDLSSGSVTEARLAAAEEADRETRIVRNSAEANAAVRRARAVALRQQAKSTKTLGVVKLGFDIGRMVVSGGQTGG